MKNICFLIGDINHSGGTERVTTLIANALDENENKIFVLSLSNGDKPFFELNKSIYVDSLFKESISMKSHFFQCIKKIRKFLVENEIDTLIVVDSISCVFTVPACIGIKVNHICWEHFNLKVNLGSSFRTLGRWMAARWCDKIVTLTERDKQFWEEEFKFKTTKKVIAIPNPSPYNLQDNIPSLNNKTILCVGRLTYQKGFDLLIQAWSQIAPKLPGWKVLIIGSGEDEQILKDMTKELNVSDSIIFLGQQKNMDEFYRQASFFCMSSRFEGLPMVLLEAQSYGLPIISFDCDTGPAEIINHGNNGYLVECFNIDKFNFYLNKIIIDNENFEKMVCSSYNNIKKFQLVGVSNLWNDLMGKNYE
ncbi:glycosyltransferase family 4 protein [Acinetobacter lwoffii]|uniref:glycosyltransferase family 4 protein n=1 Tax=Acinetobacter lwoffii TaxID=28090 RepID=UPI00342FD8D8